MSQTVGMPPVRLEGHFVRRLSFSTREELAERANLQLNLHLHPQLASPYEPDDLSIKVDVGGARHEDDPRRWRFDLRVRSQHSKGNNFPYDFEIEMTGFVGLDPKVPDDQILHVAVISGLNLLYAAAREQVANATGRGLFPSVILPTVSFLPSVQLFRDLFAQAEAQETLPQAGAKKAKRPGKAKNKRSG